MLEPQLCAMVGEVTAAPCSAERACGRPVVVYLVWQETSESSPPLVIEPACARHQADVRRLVSAVSGRMLREVPAAELARSLADLRNRGFSLVLPPPHGVTETGDVYLATDATAGPTRQLSTTLMQGRVPPHRAYIATRVERLIPPGTTVRQVFGGQCLFPYLVGPIAALCLPFIRWRVVAVADDAIYVFSATYWWRWRPRRLLRRVPRGTRLGPVAGIWSQIQLGRERVWVSWRFFDDIDAADRDLDRALGH